MFTLPSFVKVVAVSAALAISGFAQELPALDHQLVASIEKDWISSDALKSHRLKAVADKGLVTISGQVANLFEREVAVRLARRTSGVITVIDQIEVSVKVRPDAELKQDVIRALKADPATKNLTLSVTATKGVVTLTGEAATRGQRTLAAEVVSGVKGVNQIHNKVKFAKHNISDAELAKTIHELLKSHVILDTARITVNVSDGNAVLTGEVDNAYQRSHAETIAYRAGAKDVETSGVKVVILATSKAKGLREQRYVGLTDEQIQKAIIRAFANDPRILSYNPNVYVEDGVVLLGGVVGNLAAKQAAERLASYTIGVHRVTNHLKVTDVEASNDEGIAQWVREALGRDPYIDHENVIVQCENSHVSLFGVVDTEFQKKHANWTASHQNGVVDVENLLTVRKVGRQYGDGTIIGDLNERLAEIGLDESGPHVKAVAENGLVTLTGRVDTWYQWQQAIDDALGAGARNVSSKVEVTHGKPISAGYHGPFYYMPK